MADLDPKALEALKNNQRQLDQDGCEVGVSRQALDELIAAYEGLAALVPIPQSELQAENALEDAAKAAFVSAQSIYRAEHDHFPLKHTWETTHETVRDGWRKIAHASLEAAATPPLGTQPEPRRARSIADIASSTPPPIEAAQEPVAWRNVAAAPTVSKGNERLFVVAVRRARTGKVHTFPANYLNAYPLHFDEPCKECPGEGNGCGMEDGDGCPRTGWYTCSEGGEYDYTYSRLHLDPGDEHVGWCEFPSYAAPATGWRTMESAPTHRRSYSLEWDAAPRPPAHPSTMRGRQAFDTFDGAVSFMRRQPADAKFIALTEVDTSTRDRSVDVREALHAEGE